jgi:hypothetical protein
MNYQCVYFLNKNRAFKSLLKINNTNSYFLIFFVFWWLSPARFINFTFYR